MAWAAPDQDNDKGEEEDETMTTFLMGNEHRMMMAEGVGTFFAGVGDRRVCSRHARSPLQPAFADLDGPGACVSCPGGPLHGKFHAARSRRKFDAMLESLGT